MKRKVFYAVAVIVAALVLLVACAPEAPPAAPPTAPVTPAAPAAPAAPAPPKPPAVTRLTNTATALTSAWYVYEVAVAKIVNENVPGVEMTVAEGGATYDALIKMKKGYAHCSQSIALRGAGEAYTSAGRFKGEEPFKNLRIWYNYYVGPNYIIVRKDSGIKSLSDLQGKKLHAGIVGSQTEGDTKLQFEALGVEPDYFIGSAGDAITAIKDGRCDGIAIDAAADWQPPGSILELHAFTPITVIPYSETEMATVLKRLPDLFKCEIPAGTIKVCSDLPTFLTRGQVVHAYIVQDVNADLVYAMTKAIHEKWEDELVLVMPAFKGVDIMERTAYYGPQGRVVVPIHAGTVRYLEELGYKLPATSIPPEYKK